MAWAELDDEFQRVGSDTVRTFVMEPVVGTTLGCVPAPDRLHPSNETSP